MRDYVAIAEDVYSYMVEARRHIHEYPCLTNDELETSRYISSQLTNHGIEHYVDEEGNVIARVDGVSSKRIALRADMDALPILEETSLDFTSKVPGVMHACGHDLHVANLLGVAKVISSKDYALGGTVYLCFQVGEEQSKGAKKILEYLDSVGGVETCLGLHVDPNLNTGIIQSKVGPLMSGSSLFTIKVKGVGGHGSTPWLSLDPIKAACDITTRLASLAATEFSAFDSVVINPCAINSGTAGNIIPDEAIIKGTIRYFKAEHYEAIASAITRVINGIAASYGCTAEIKMSSNRTPPMIADCRSFNRLQKVMENSTYVLEEMEQPWMASDNYSTYLAKYGGIYLFGGVAKEGTVSYPIHTSRFNPDESALKVFCSVFLGYIDEFFSE